MPTILVIDDSTIVRKLATRMLTKRNFAVVEAGHGADGLEICRTAMPDGILLDWNMPVMDGLAFLKALRSSPRGDVPKVLLCTAESETDKIMAAIEAGANEFIMKPFDEDILASKLEMVGL